MPRALRQRSEGASALLIQALAANGVCGGLIARTGIDTLEATGVRPQISKISSL
jgi:hypothetical protein